MAASLRSAVTSISRRFAFTPVRNVESSAFTFPPSYVAFRTKAAADVSNTGADGGAPLVSDRTIAVTFLDGEGHRVTVPARVGQTIAEVARHHDIPLDTPCDGACSCEFCHVALCREMINKVNAPSLEETQLLKRRVIDAGETSRLGCQVILSAENDGITVALRSVRESQIP
mmetsp:Transcript_45211/g.117014  ORF Transcript_45211/g.117014 Transcript_45211/m.117014 type:complete len:172 (+) Transcript_45211:81-596(+)